MARGLSDLQKAILLLAYRKRCEREAKLAQMEKGSHEWRVLKHGVGSPDLYFAEVLHEHFGFNVHSIWWRPNDGERPTWGNNFSMLDIGEQRYRTAQASLSRAVKRLQERGLVNRVHHLGLATLYLTEEGIQVAERLSVNSSRVRVEC